MKIFGTKSGRNITAQCVVPDSMKFLPEDTLGIGTSFGASGCCQCSVLLSCLLICYQTTPVSILILIVVMIIALSILDLTLNLTDNSIKLSLTNKECSKLEDEWMKLWLNANSDEVDESRVGEKHFALVERFTATTIDVDDAIIYRNRRLNLKCEEIVHEYMANKYRYA